MTRFLCWVQAAQLLTAGDVCDVLEGAIRAEDSQAVFYFCEALPGLLDLEAGHITRLLLVCMTGSGSSTSQAYQCSAFLPAYDACCVVAVALAATASQHRARTCRRRWTGTSTVDLSIASPMLVPGFVNPGTLRALAVISWV